MLARRLEERRMWDLLAGEYFTTQVLSCSLFFIEFETFMCSLSFLFSNIFKSSKGGLTAGNV